MNGRGSKRTDKNGQNFRVGGTDAATGLFDGLAPRVLPGRRVTGERSSAALRFVQTWERVDTSGLRETSREAARNRAAAARRKAPIVVTCHAAAVKKAPVGAQPEGGR